VPPHRLLWATRAAPNPSHRRPPSSSSHLTAARGRHRHNLSMRPRKVAAGLSTPSRRAAPGQYGSHLVDGARRRWHLVAARSVSLSVGDAWCVGWSPVPPYCWGLAAPWHRWSVPHRSGGLLDSSVLLGGSGGMVVASGI
jgi:hypothetical protein